MAMESFRFTTAAIRALPLPTKRTRYGDTGQPGLVVALMPGGSRTFYLYVWRHGKQHEPRIGDVERVSVEEARRIAREKLGAIEAGESPAGAGNRRGGDTIGDLFAWWAGAFGKRRRARWDDTADLWRLHVEPQIGRRPVAYLTRDDVRTWHAAIGASGRERTANAALGLLQTVLNAAVREGRWKGQNIAAGLERYTRPERRRVLTRDELPRFLAAVEASTPDLRDLVLLLLWTGQRVGNVVAMRWDQVDLLARAWVIPETKAGRTHAVALGEREVAILSRRQGDRRGPWVFPSRAGAKAPHMSRMQSGWAGILKRAGIEDLTIHDLRRTHGSLLLAGGVSIDHVSKVLDHSSVRVTERVYAHLDLDAKHGAKRAMEAALDAGPKREPKVPRGAIRPRAT
jgi:integrase